MDNTKCMITVDHIVCDYSGMHVTTVEHMVCDYSGMHSVWFQWNA